MVFMSAIGFVAFINAQESLYNEKMLDSIAVKSAEHKDYDEALGYFYIKNALYGSSAQTKLMEVQTISFMLNNYGAIGKKPKAVLCAFVALLTNILPEYSEPFDIATIRWVRAKTSFALIYYVEFFDKMEDSEFNSLKKQILEDLDYCYDNLSNSYKPDIETMKKKTVGRDINKLRF